MSTPYPVAVITGSLREDSLSRKAANELIRLAPATLAPELVEIGGLPLYNQDLEGADAPAAWTRFRERMKAARAVLFVTPEYNRSIPGLLKNAIDVGSRPWGEAVWNGRPAAIMSLSMGALGGFGANQHLRQALLFFGMPLLQQPEAYIGNAGTLFDADGRLQAPETEAFFRSFVEAFAGLVERNAKTG